LLRDVLHASKLFMGQLCAVDRCPQTKSCLREGHWGPSIRTRRARRGDSYAGERRSSPRRKADRAGGGVGLSAGRLSRAWIIERALMSRPTLQRRPPAHRLPTEWEERLPLAGLSSDPSGGGGNRTPVPGRPFRASPGAAGGKVSPRGSHRRRTSRPARVRCPAAAPGRSRNRQPAHDAHPPVAGDREGTAT
jgi:hypothetical protein